MPEKSLQRLGDYLLLERVGEGGMAEVFLAQYTGEEHSVGPMSQVVVKRIKPDLYTKPEFPIFREMFLNEAKLVRSLQHPNLARVYALMEAVDPGLGKKIPFIVQEYVRGQPLWELLRIATRGFTGLGVPVGIATFIGREMARGLGHAHAHKDSLTGKPQPIIHRDISPENIMVSVEGAIKVIDFGVAKAIGGFGPQTRTGIIKGKLAYMAPEQVAQKVVPATDVFGAAIVLHEMLTGRRLFGGHNDFVVISRVLKAEIPRPSQLVKGIPKELDDVVMTALSRDLKVRYVDGNALADALTRVMAKLPEMKGLTSTQVKAWSKQVIAEGERISSNWGEEESGVHVDVEEAVRRAEASGDDILELTAEDMMKADIEGSLDPGVHGAVTHGLKSLRPDMLPRAQRPAQPSTGDAADSSAPALAPLSAVAAAPATGPVPAMAPTPASGPVARQPTPPAVPAIEARRPTPPPLPVVAATRASAPLQQISATRPSAPLQQISATRPSAPLHQISATRPSAPLQQISATRPSAPLQQISATRPSAPLPQIAPAAPVDVRAELAPPAVSDPAAAETAELAPMGVPAKPASASSSQKASTVSRPHGPQSAADLPLPTSGHRAFIDKQVDRWVKVIAGLVVLALVLLLLLLLRD